MNKVTFYANGLQFVIEEEKVDQLQDRAAELASAAPAIIESLVAVVAAGNAVEAFKKVGTDTSGKVNDRPPVNKGVQPGASGIPNCKCGLPMSDVRGKTYKAGPKQGQPYPKSFYPSRDCTAKCDAV